MNKNTNQTNIVPKMLISKAAEFLGVTKQAVHQKIRTKNLTCPKMGRNSYINYTIAKPLFSIVFKPLVVAIEIVKGGTGKTTSVDNIGACANTYGAKVLLLDGDAQANLTEAKGIDAETLPTLIDVLNKDSTIQKTIVNLCPGLDLIPSRIENVVIDNQIIFNKLPLDRFFHNLLRPIVKDYDLVLIDLPPALGSLVTAASLYADIIVSPLNPDKFSAKGLKILQEELKKLNTHYEKNINYKVFLNKYSGNTILSGKAYKSLTEPTMEGKVLQTAVRHSQEIPNLIDTNKNLFITLKKSLARDDYDLLTRELLGITPSKKI